MAQWMGQFSGLTHATKVHAIEESLRLAVKSLAAAGAADTVRKAKAVRHLSERLLAARLRQLRASISTLTEPGQDASRKQVARLEMRELRDQGVEGILKEFGIQEHPSC